MLVVGLTGGIGSGKTTVANLFAKFDVPIIDTDQLSRDLSKPGQAGLLEIQKQFGPDVITTSGELDRSKLREIIFADASKRHTLEAILHPLIREEISRIINTLDKPYCIVVIPLLFESEINPIINRTLVIDTLEDLQISRTIKRDNVKDEHVQSIMSTQVQRKHRLDKADDVIVNDKKIEDLEEQVATLHAFYLELSSNKFP